MVTRWLIENVGLPALKILAIIAGILAMLMGFKKWGQNAERVEQKQRELQGVKIRREIEDRVNGTNPANNDLLRHPSKRGDRKLSVI